MFNGKKTFGDFIGSSEKISTTVLTSRLCLLKSHQIIDFVPDLKDKKVKVYYLTDKGIDLFPLIYEIFYWGMSNFSNNIIPPKSLANFKKVKGMSSDQVINKAQKKYLKIRSGILN